MDPKGAIGETKCQLHLIFRMPGVLRSLANVMKLGASEYGPFNWRECDVDPNTYLSAIGRHLLSHCEGDLIDAKSGEPHLAHVMANCAILMDKRECVEKTPYVHLFDEYKELCKKQRSYLAKGVEARIKHLEATSEPTPMRHD